MSGEMGPKDAVAGDLGQAAEQTSSSGGPTETPALTDGVHTADAEGSGSDELPRSIATNLGAMTDGEFAVVYGSGELSPPGPASPSAGVVADTVRTEQHAQHAEKHYSGRAQWLRAAVLGANDGLLSTAALILGVDAGSTSQRDIILAGISGMVAGALSMACGEYISVASQRDSEEADIATERQEQAKGPSARLHELDELTDIYLERGLSPALAREVAVELSRVDVIKAHARDELGIDLDAAAGMSHAGLAAPLVASVASAASFVVGAAVPILASAFITAKVPRTWSVVGASTGGLMCFGATGAALGGAPLIMATLRVLLGGWIAMAVTYGIGYALG